MYFFFNDTATTEIYTLSLHDALPICRRLPDVRHVLPQQAEPSGRRDRRYHSTLEERGLRQGWRRDGAAPRRRRPGERKSTRLHSRHANISYAVFCLKKKKHLHLTLLY